MVTTSPSCSLLGRTDSTEQSYSLGPDSHSASQEIPRLLWKPKVHFHVHKNPLLDPVLSKMNSVPNSHPNFLHFILILSSHLRLGLPSDPFSSVIIQYGITIFILSSLTTYVPPYSRVLLQKLIVTQLVKKNSALYGNRRFITVFTAACHWSLS